MYIYIYTVFYVYNKYFFVFKIKNLGFEQRQ